MYAVFIFHNICFYDKHLCFIEIFNSSIQLNRMMPVFYQKFCKFKSTREEKANIKAILLCQDRDEKQCREHLLHLHGINILPMRDYGKWPSLLSKAFQTIRLSFSSLLFPLRKMDIFLSIFLYLIYNWNSTCITFFIQKERGQLQNYFLFHFVLKISGLWIGKGKLEITFSNYCILQRLNFLIISL